MKAIIFYVIMAAILLTILVMGIKKYYSQTQKTIIETGFMMQVQCRKCGYKRELSVKDFPFGGMTKSSGVSKPKMRGPAVVNETTYHSYAKKIHCLQCGDKQWTDVLNINEYQEKFRGLIIRNALIFAAIMLILLRLISLVLMPLSKILL